MINKHRLLFIYFSFLSVIGQSHVGEVKIMSQILAACYFEIQLKKRFKNSMCAYTLIKNTPCVHIITFVKSKADRSGDGANHKCLSKTGLMLARIF